MALDQMFFMRPVPGWSRYETPIEGLELAEGSHQVEVRKKGFEPYRTAVEARVGESVQLLASDKVRRDLEK